MWCYGEILSLFSSLEGPMLISALFLVCPIGDTKSWG